MRFGNCVPKRSVSSCDLRFKTAIWSYHQGQGCNLGNCVAKTLRFCVCVWRATKLWTGAKHLHGPECAYEKDNNEAKVSVVETEGHYKPRSKKSVWVRENQTCTKSWLPFCVPFAPLFPKWKWPFSGTGIPALSVGNPAILQDLLYESTVFPRREIGGKRWREMVALNFGACFILSGLGISKPTVRGTSVVCGTHCRGFASFLWFPLIQHSTPCL